ncbi:hypothetical protein OG426_04645 [Streptomyces canus]|nr:hypothetical protein OG426_04645 [Streptomyces canus]
MRDLPFQSAPDQLSALASGKVSSEELVCETAGFNAVQVPCQVLVFSWAD